MALNITYEVPDFIANNTFTTRWFFTGDTPISGAAVDDWILRRTDGVFTNLSSSNTTLTRVGTTDNYDLEITLSGNIDADYGVRLRGNRIQDSLGGSFPSGSISTTEFRILTNAPSPPQNLTLIEGDGQLTAQWQTPADTGGGNLTYEISTDGTNYSDAGADLQETITGLTNGTMRTVYVRAVSGGSVRGSPVTAMGTPMAPTVEAGSFQNLSPLPASEYSDVEFAVGVQDPNDADQTIARRADVAAAQEVLVTADRLVNRVQALTNTQRGLVQTALGIGAGGFDLFDDVGTETTDIADNDRFVIADRSETGDPNRWASGANVRGSLGPNITNIQNVFNTFNLTEQDEIRESIGITNATWTLIAYLNTGTLMRGAVDSNISDIINDPRYVGIGTTLILSFTIASTFITRHITLPPNYTTTNTTIFTQIGQVSLTTDLTSGHSDSFYVSFPPTNPRTAIMLIISNLDYNP